MSLGGSVRPVAGAALVAAALVGGAACAPRAGRATAAPAAHWVGSWAASPQLVEPRNLPPAPGLAGHTLRQVVHLSLGGAPIRVRVANTFGDGPVTIGAARIARSAGGDSIVPGTSQVIRFGGAPSVTIAAGATATSDPLDVDVAPLGDLTVSTYVESMPPDVTGHPGSRTTSFIEAGDATAERTMHGAVRVEHWYLLAGIDVIAPAGSAAVVALGNSITDGRGSGTDRNDRWPDELARRLAADPRTATVAVLNAGIGGNAVLRGGLGPTALDRLDRDALDQPGVRWLIVLEGVNDIGTAAPDSSAATADALVAAYRQIADRAHRRGLRVYGATILPFGGSFYDHPAREAARQRVNAWIRTAGAFDAVIDFDAALRDPAAPSRLVSSADGGDHLHPNEAGYSQMASAVDLSLFQP